VSGFDVFVEYAYGAEPDDHYGAGDGDQLLTVLESILESKTILAVTIRPVYAPPIPTSAIADVDLSLVHYRADATFAVLCGATIVKAETRDAPGTLGTLDPTAVTCRKCRDAVRDLYAAGRLRSVPGFAEWRPEIRFVPCQATRSGVRCDRADGHPGDHASARSDMRWAAT
jgi:hypothetical protein